MLSFPNAKINLGLNITEKRADGYHNIESCFYPIPLKDALEIIPATASSFQSTGLDIPGNQSDNLVWKAYQLLKSDFDLPEIDIILHKAIPMGAGIGGGSADAAFMLKILNDYFDLRISTQKLEDFALKLGSDCPFFIENTPKYVTGRGEQMKPIPIELKGYYLGLIFPGVHVSTKAAYAGIIPKTPSLSVEEIIENYPIRQWKSLLKNDFEESVITQLPQLKGIKERLYEAGALYASMTGSGSTFYGIFKESPDNKFIDKVMKL